MDNEKFKTAPGDENNNVIDSVSVDEDQRIKVLSPTMLVVKRFFRNKLAIAGMVCLIIMFLFSFVGGWVSPYREDQVFYKEDTLIKDYASATVNNEYRYTNAPGRNFPLSAQAQFISAVRNRATIFEWQGIQYNVTELNEDFYLINEMSSIAKVIFMRDIPAVAPLDTNLFNSSIEQAFIRAHDSGLSEFSVGGLDYFITTVGRESFINVVEPIAIATKWLYDVYDTTKVAGFDFMLESELAIAANKASFTFDGVEHRIEQDGDLITIYRGDGGVFTEFANVSTIVVQPFVANTWLSIDFKAKVKEAIIEGLSTFNYAVGDGEEEEFTVVRRNTMWEIRRLTTTQVIDVYASPSISHWFGTDYNGMDILTRLMYGGRVSLIIGFIVIIISGIIGVVLGGVAGYFGRWVDNLIMRIVDIFNCIPTLPLIIIIGAVMDGMRVAPTVRIAYIMVILGLLSWPGIARVVRGQILSLREQEFMIATEATGISVYRRIFKHLVPNVIPQLIVISTMGLGGIILTESTLSFLGLGVKFPYASWGNIITAVSNAYVMTNYWFVWIPAGFCILVTVLGFNFIGDGLRDAFDPKMKR